MVKLSSKSFKIIPIISKETNMSTVPSPSFHPHVLQSIQFCRNTQQNPCTEDDLRQIQRCSEEITYQAKPLQDRLKILYQEMRGSPIRLTKAIYVNRNPKQLYRSLIIGMQGECYILMTRCKKEGDRIIGTGGFKTVKLAVGLYNGQVYALAVSKPGKAWDETVRVFRNEIAYMSKPENYLSRIITCYASVEVFKGAKRPKCFFIMELCNGGDLFAAVKRPIEKRVSKVVIQLPCFLTFMVHAVQDIHQNGRVHADLKPENIFLKQENGNTATPMIGDMGLSVQNNFCSINAKGTVEFMPPDLAGFALKKIREKSSTVYSYRTPLDVWCLGLIFFTVLHPECAHLIKSKSRENKGIEILTETANLTDEIVERRINNSGIDIRYLTILKGMLRVNPNERWTLEAVDIALIKFPSTMQAKTLGAPGQKRLKIHSQRKTT